jgi:arylsulfatase A-like enzyme
MSSTSPQRANCEIRTLITLTIFGAYFYVFMEWLFFVTKPSSLSIVTWLEKVRVLFVTGGVIALTFLLGLALLTLPAFLISNPTWRPRLLYLAYLVPAFVFTLTALILFDNFTYTVFKFGIVTTVKLWRGLYAAGFLILLWWMIRSVRIRAQVRQRPASRLALGLLTVSTLAILSVALTHQGGTGLGHNSLEISANQPNILILAGDGLNAQYLSLYGYTHDTTPFLTELAKTSLLAENAFTNASGTTASTTSMLTGQEPAAVKVYRYPDVLTGNDSFEHLPGILKQEGYETDEIGTSYYMDARELNLLDGFDIVNDQSQDQPFFNLVRSVLGSSPSSYFIWTVFNRASERLLHIFFIHQMQNPLAEVYNPAQRISDQQRVNEILDLLDHADRPVFVIAYFLDTHGPDFFSSGEVFENSTANAEWDQGQYEAAIRSFDGSVEQIYNHLVETGGLDNTILVVTTDHGYKYTTFNRIPMLIHFPKEAHAGTRVHNIQMIDMPVTLLDYLGNPKPAWMTGLSFLNGETPVDRQIISITAGSPSKIKPPFYQIQSVQVQICQKTYTLNVQTNFWTTGTPSGYTTGCEMDLLPPDKEIHQAILDYLAKHGYDVSSLK